MKLEFSIHIFEKFSNIKFHENPSSGSRVVPCGQTDGQTARQTGRHDEANSGFRNFATAPKNTLSTYTRLSTVKSLQALWCTEIAFHENLKIRTIYHAIQIRQEVMCQITPKKEWYLSSPSAQHVSITNTQITPWCKILLEKLAGLQLVKKFPAFYATRRFITALTSVRLT